MTILVFTLLFFPMNAETQLASCPETIALVEQAFTREDAPSDGMKEHFKNLKDTFLSRFHKSIGIQNSADMPSEIFDTIKDNPLAFCHFLRDAYLDFMEQYTKKLEEELLILQLRIEEMDSLTNTLGSLASYIHYLEATTPLRFEPPPDEQQQ